MKLRFTARAVRDLVEIADYIRRENPAAAFASRFLNRFGLSANFPQ
jgi:plasmid stabilization system protein ParE